MAMTHERNKSARTRKGCIFCFQMGGASPTFAYIRIRFIPMYRPDNIVEKELGLCFKHCRAKTENNPTGLLDPSFGTWEKRFGLQPLREQLYQLVGGPTNTQIITGKHGRIPIWWIIPLMFILRGMPCLS